MHLGGGRRQARLYNPGLATAVVLFIPDGVAALWMVGQAGAGVGWHVLGLAVAIGVHAVIIAYALAREAPPRRLARHSCAARHSRRRRAGRSAHPSMP